MLGLIEKDLCILKQRKNFFLMMIVVSGVLAFTTEPSFIIGYLTLLCSIFALSTLNYDEFDNCYAFLMTLPVNEKIYVIEKFVFSALLAISAFAVSVVLVTIAGIAKGQMLPVSEILSYLVCIAPLGLIFLALNLPFQLKFGQEKSRLVMVGMVSICILVVYLVEKVIPKETTAQVVDMVENAPTAVLALIGVIVFAAILTISSVISIAIMKKKEY